MNKQVISTFVLALCLGVNAASDCQAAAVVGQPVDLTVAAEKSVNSVVYIKVVQNEKVQSIHKESFKFGTDDYMWFTKVDLNR